MKLLKHGISIIYNSFHMQHMLYIYANKISRIIYTFIRMYEPIRGIKLKLSLQTCKLNRNSDNFFMGKSKKDINQIHAYNDFFYGKKFR